jgi:acetoin utilization protein AcuB
MVRRLITINPDAKVSDAVHLMKKHSIRHLPVIDEDEFAGFISESDIRQVLVLPGADQISINEVMIKDPITISPDENLEDAARVIFQYKIGGLPVIEHGKLVGIITVGDILAAFIEIMGVLQSSSRIDVVLGDKPQAFEEVSRIVKENGGEIISVGMGTHPDNKKKVYFFRLRKCDMEPIAEAIKQKDYEIVSVIG